MVPIIYQFVWKSDLLYVDRWLYVASDLRTLIHCVPIKTLTYLFFE